jgi:GNAT superfamily N-acetyltransferase
LKQELKKIRISELKSFINNEAFAEMEVIPISPSRAISYTKNPHARPKDVALYLCFADGKLVAFRSVFAGLANGNEKIRFGWCSGNWVHPDFRRKGLPQQLLNEVYQDWNGKLMFTNYAPASEKLYLKTGWFHAIHQFNGARAYIFPKTAKILPVAKKSAAAKFFLQIVDYFLALFTRIKTLFFNPERNSDVEFRILDFPDAECYQFIEQQITRDFFSRGEKELKWIFEWPWISGKNRFVASKYPFSSLTESFYYQTVKVLKKNKLEGIFIFSVRAGHLKTLHVHLPENLEYDSSLFLKTYCTKHKIEFATIYHSGMAEQLIKGKFPFLHIKPFGQKIYSSFEIKDPENFHFQDGDGDTVFT